MRCCDDKDLTIKPIRIFVSQKSQLWQLQPMIHIHLEHSMNAPEILAYTFKTFIHSTTGKAPQRSTFTQKSAIPLQGRLHNAPQSPRTLPFHYREGSTTLHIHPELCHSTTGKAPQRSTFTQNSATHPLTRYTVQTGLEGGGGWGARACTHTHTHTHTHTLTHSLTRTHAHARTHIHSLCVGGGGG